MNRSRWLFPLVASAALLVAGASFAFTVHQKQSAEDAKAAAQSELVKSAETIRAGCMRDPAQVRTLLGPTACTDAKAIIDRPPAEKGETGARGATGAQGPVGPQGAPGPQGPTGKPGPAGQQPGCLILVSKCQGPTGPRGLEGLTGAQGAAGVDGTDGVDGKDGAAGTDGAPGDAGPKGDPGPQGTPGPDGPVCETGSSLEKQQVITTEFPTGVWILVCVLDNQQP